jgi:hypothetical protein
MILHLPPEKLLTIWKKKLLTLFKLDQNEISSLPNAEYRFDGEKCVQTVRNVDVSKKYPNVIFLMKKLDPFL